MLNYFIVNSLYQRYFYKYIHIQHDISAAKRTLVEKGAIFIQKYPEPVNETTFCLKTPHVGVIISTETMKSGNDVSQQNSLLTRLRTVTRGSDVRVLIFTNYETFHPMHRTICQSFSKCTLIVTETSELHVIFDALTKHKPCMKSVALLGDNVRIDASFLQRLALTKTDKVACIVVSGTLDKCPAMAYTIPRAFFTSHRTRSVDIIPTARIMGLMGGPIPVVSKKPPI